MITKLLKDLFKEAMKTNSSKNDRLALLEFIENDYHDWGWNGESYDLYNGYRIYPVYEGDGEPDEDGDFASYKLVNAEIK